MSAHIRCPECDSRVAVSKLKKAIVTCSICGYDVTDEIADNIKQIRKNINPSFDSNFELERQRQFEEDVLSVYQE